MAPGGRGDRMTASQPGPGPQHQHLRALARANEVRLARAELKRQVLSGELPAATVILDVPWAAETMSIADLLLSQRRWGHTRVRKLLSTIPMSEGKTVGSMTERQRGALATALGAAEPRTRPPVRESVLARA